MKKFKYIKISFDEFVANIYLSFAKVTKRSWKVDERIARKYFSCAFGHLLLEQIDNSTVCRWFAKLIEQNLAPATCNRILAVLKAIFSFAIKNGYLPKGCSPCAGISQLPVHCVRQRILSREEAKKLMTELKKHRCQEAAAIQLLLLTGARKSEILNARWENIDLKGNTLIIPLSKSGRPRQIVLSDEAVKIIKILAQKATGPWLFAGKISGKPLSDIYVFWNKIRHKLGLSGVRIHDLRHSFASFLINAGHSLYEIQKLLGHANPSTTMRYAHLSQNSLLSATQAVWQMITSKQASWSDKRQWECPLAATFYNFMYGKMGKAITIKS